MHVQVYVLVIARARVPHAGYWHGSDVEPITLVPIPNLSYWQPITQGILLLYNLTHVCALNLLDELSIVISRQSNCQSVCTHAELCTCALVTWEYCMRH